MMPSVKKPDRRDFERRAILQNHPIFGALGPELLDRLSSYAILQTVKRGTTVFARGDPGTSLFAVCSGTVKISAPSPGGRDAVFNLITDGAIFGEIAVLDGLPRTADATAITDCSLMTIERRHFISLVYERPDFALKLIEVLCGRLRHTTEQVENVMFLDLPSRLAKALLQLAERAKSSQARRIALTQRDVGEMIGMSRESTNKQLRIWQKRNWIRLERGGIVIVAPEALARIASMMVTES
ncbi:MAG TPA: Crp/Fnr family transcriptional regulator [Xanthobacteraceae bacterium]|jgi:CRP-like cAMP-binding protein